MNFKIRMKQNFPTSYHIEVRGITVRVSGFRTQTKKKKKDWKCVGVFP
jgi:hypothetical protein